ncbi:MAG: hypothetical protein IKP51_04640 [Treponema sp.]|nr:hypothetical protein [Treponema sp.]
MARKTFLAQMKMQQKKARQALEGWAKAHSGGSAQRDQRNGAEGRNPGSATQGACFAAKKTVCPKSKCRKKKKKMLSLNKFEFYLQKKKSGL